MRILNTTMPSSKTFVILYFNNPIGAQTNAKYMWLAPVHSAKPKRGTVIPSQRAWADITSSDLRLTNYLSLGEGR